jgi:uncharacterized protein
MPMASTPDIVSVVETHTLSKMCSDSIRHSERGKVVGIEATGLMRSVRALAVVRQRAFGLDLNYRSVATMPDGSGQRAGSASGAARVNV